MQINCGLLYDQLKKQLNFNINYNQSGRSIQVKTKTRAEAEIVAKELGSLGCLEMLVFQLPSLKVYVCEATMPKEAKVSKS
jgi:hypothetical protein